jgi:hypothetical protein
MKRRGTVMRALCGLGVLLVLGLSSTGNSVASPNLGTLFVSSTEGNSVTRINLDTLASQTFTGFPSAEGIACGTDGRVYLALSGVSGHTPRRIVRFKQDGTGLETVLDFASTPALANTGAPDGLSFALIKQDDGRLVPGGELFFNTRASQGNLHTGVWKLPAVGTTPVQVILPFAGEEGNGEATAFLTTGPFAGHLLAADFLNGRILRRAPPFNSSLAADEFITGLFEPSGVAIKPNAPDAGQIFVSERSTTNIKGFASDGKLVGPHDGFFVQTGLEQRKIGFDDAGNLYVATISGPVLRYTPPSTTQSIIGTVLDGNGVTVCPARIPATIDVLPGTFPNRINIKSTGVIPVAILSTPYYDAPSRVNQHTVRFGPTGTEAIIDGLCKSEDVNHDGVLDLLCRFRIQDAKFKLGDTVARIRWGNQDFEGLAAVVVVSE